MDNRPQYGMYHVVLRRSIGSTDPRDYITAYLLMPRPRTRRCRPWPAIIALHQTVAQGKDEVIGNGALDMAYAVELAERGYIVLAPDLLLAGERVLGQRAWDLSAHPVDERPSLVGRHVLDTIACVDYLRTIRDVDPSRIGLIGHSQGAITAFRAGALDPRVAVTVANDGFMTFRDDPRLLRWQRLIPDVTPEMQYSFDPDEVAALTAPRALMISNHLEDKTIPQSRAFLAVEQILIGVYDLYSADEHIRVSLSSGHHGFPIEQRMESYAFIDRQLAIR